jgi:hypothetical protein
VRRTRVLGGLCAKGHRLTPDNIYTDRGRIRCATCHLERCAINQRKRTGAKPKYRTDPDALWTCRCGKTMIRREFGTRGRNKDGTMLYQSVCGPCRVRASNERVKEQTAIRLQAEREERANLTQWVITQAWRLKRECKVPVERTREALGVPRKTWHEWTSGSFLPELSRLRVVIEAMQAWMARHQAPSVRPSVREDGAEPVSIRRAHRVAREEQRRVAA